MKLTNYEKETIILFNDEEKEAEVYTCNKALMRKMDGLCKKQPENFKLVKKDSVSKTYTFPKNLVSIRAKRVLTEKQKQSLKKARESKTL